MTSNSRLYTLKSKILDILSSCGENEALKRKKITSKCIKESQLDNLNKSEVKKSLRELVGNGKVKELKVGGSSRYMMCSDDDSESSGGSASDSSSDGRGGDSEGDADDDNVRDEPLPFAELMRKRQEKRKCDGMKISGDKKGATEVEEEEDTDEEIRRLEAELAADSDGDDSSDYSEGSDDESISVGMEEKSKKMISFGPPSEYADDRMNESDEPVFSEGGIIRSNLEAERIAPLPKSALPQMKRRKLKGIDGDVADDTNGSDKKKKKKRSDNTEDKAVNDGLREAVKEVLSGYEARSHERIPFYCRVCSVQSKGMESFLAHKKTDFHKAAVKAERKATYCQACRKQFTSPVQMEEHLNSKPHHERMVYLRSKNQGGQGRGGRAPGCIGGRGRFGRGGRGYGGRGRGDGRAGSNRQWC